MQGVYTRISVYRDWINYTISTNTRDYDNTQLFNMPNNIEMNNELEIWWDRETDKGNNIKLKMNLLVFCLFCFIIKIKSE